MAVTLAVPIVIELLARVLLPGLAREALGSLSALGLSDVSPTIGVLALGLVPIVIAFVGVELACIAVPSWRRLRTGGPQTRARLGRAVAITAVLIAGVQAYNLALYLDQMTWSMPELVPRPGFAFRAVVILTLLAGMAVIWLATVIIDRLGLGNGFSVLIAAAIAVQTGEQLLQILKMARQGIYTPLQILVWLAALVSVIYFSWRMLTFEGHRIDGPSRLPSALRLPATGLSPLEAAVTLLAIPSLVLSLWWLDTGGVPRFQLDGLTHFAIEVGLLVGFAVGFAILYHQPCRVARAWALLIDASKNEMAEHVKRLTRAALLPSVKYLVLIGAAVAVMTQVAGDDAYWRAGIAVAAVAVALDLRAEWRFRRRHGELVAVWALHRVYLIDVVLAALAERGITAHARGARHRTILQFPGPYVPVEIVVPETDADQARELLTVLERR